ncbi:MAG TPA: hypothetical protein VFI22_00945, partial [Thermomicrobiales bacterium]|nr:hypothetical protein [Thermomicrobiales bacterium]
MANISSPSERARPRGSTVWVGLDPFGAAVVERLRRWLGDDEIGRELAAANRLLPLLTLPSNEPAPPSEREDDDAAEPPPVDGLELADPTASEAP